MWQLRDAGRSEPLESALPFLLGAVGGLAVGVLVSRRAPEWQQSVGERVHERVHTITDRIGPGRLRRAAGDQNTLVALEDAVLDALLADSVLAERAIDVGAISHGIIELSGTVRTEREADLAVAAARRVSGVSTVVNRLGSESEIRHQSDVQRRLENGDAALGEAHWEGRMSGMGRMRQGSQTEPDRPDDSQHRTERALEQADRAQFAEEGYHHRPLMAARPGTPAPEPDFREDELDNQDPHGKRAAVTLDDQPQELNTASRVGEGMKPGTELQLEQSGVDIDGDEDRR
jgi:hypothetical protein